RAVAECQGGLLQLEACDDVGRVRPTLVRVAGLAAAGRGLLASLLRGEVSVSPRWWSRDRVAAFRGASDRLAERKGDALGLGSVLKPGLSNRWLRPEEVFAAALSTRRTRMPATRTSAFDHIRPRPVSRIPDFAPAPARKRTAEALETAFGLSPESARAVADAIVDHGQARDSIRNPERRRVPGGELIMVAADAWSARLGFDPANMRTAQNQIHPFAVAPGTGAENSRFAPIRQATSDPSGRPELVAEVDSRVHLEWGYGRAAEYVLAHNDWTDSIAAQGVMEAVWVTAVRYRHRDDQSTLVVPQSSEGSSRVTATHHNMA